MCSSSDNERQKRQQQRQCLLPSSPDIKTAPAEPEHSDFVSGGDCTSYKNNTKNDDDDVCMEDATTVSTFGHEEDSSPSLRTGNSNDSNISSSSSNNTNNNDVVFDDDESMEDAPATVAPIIGDPPPTSSSSQPSILTATTTTTARSQTGRTVRFGTVETREYPMTLGANPATRSGAPVCLDWDYRSIRTVSLKENEHRNKQGRRYRTPGYGCYLSYYQRQAIVSRAGCSKEEVLEAERIIKSDRFKRKLSELGSLPVLWIRSWGIGSGRRRSRRFVKQYRKEHGLDVYGRQRESAK